VLTTGSAGRAHAQENRADDTAKKQADKAAKSAPYQPNAYEKFMNTLEEAYVNPPSGFFPALGSVYPGGGFTLGAGYRHFYAREAVWEIKGLYSIKNYKQIEVGTRTPWNWNNQWGFGLKGGWRDAPQIGYYGLGMGSVPEDRANFRIKQAYATGTMMFKPSWWTILQADVSYEDFKTEEGKGRAPSIETIYNPTTAPGLFSAPKYIHTEATGAIDWRPSAAYARSGGYYGVTFHDYSDRDKTFSFQRLDGEIVQHLPMLRETLVLSVRGRVQSTLDDNDVVPYYLLPYLGSGNTLRAYSTGRFRDRHSILTSAEFRWIPNLLGMDMAIFYDAGKVTRRRSELDFNGFENDYGIGVRFHSPAATFLRLELAQGADGLHFVISSSAAF
jgi:hypothetical protein